MIQFEYIQATEESAKQILEWRNDPTTRAMSFHTALHSWDSYYHSFLQRTKMFPDLPLLFAVKEGIRLAYLQLDPYPHPATQHLRCCNISINVAPEWRGAGIGKEILLAVNGWVKQQGYHAIYAEVKPENIASQRVMQKCGLRYEKEAPYFGYSLVCYQILKEEYQPGEFPYRLAGRYNS